MEVRNKTTGEPGFAIAQMGKFSRNLIPLMNKDGTRQKQFMTVPTKQTVFATEAQIADSDDKHQFLCLKMKKHLSQKQLLVQPKKGLCNGSPNCFVLTPERLDAFKKLRFKNKDQTKKRRTPLKKRQQREGYMVLS